ncbi:MAG TPA: GH36 C-terminal domain-containing protein, partial [Candidatus Limnocylindrales bacterium]
LDPTVMSDEERAAVREQVALYKGWRSVLQRGRFVRLRSPFEGDGNEAAWMTISEDRKRAVGALYRVLNRPLPGPHRLRLRGLDPAATYRVSVWPWTGSGVDAANTGLRSGDELMHAGLALAEERDVVAARGDFHASLFLIEAT